MRRLIASIAALVALTVLGGSLQAQCPGGGGFLEGGGGGGESPNVLALVSITIVDSEESEESAMVVVVPISFVEFGSVSYTQLMGLDRMDRTPRLHAGHRVPGTDDSRRLRRMGGRERMGFVGGHHGPELRRVGSSRPHDHGSAATGMSQRRTVCSHPPGVPARRDIGFAARTPAVRPAAHSRRSRRTRLNWTYRTTGA